MTSPCPLCTPTGEDILYLTDLYRIISVNDPQWPGFCRVILNAHVAEMSDLPDQQRTALMKAVFVTESGLRDLMAPTKINLASLGNVVPHVHWHVIPRWNLDSHFPDPIWATAQRDWPNKPTLTREELVARLNNDLG